MFDHRDQKIKKTLMDYRGDVIHLAKPCLQPTIHLDLFLHNQIFEEYSLIQLPMVHRL